MKRGQHPVSLVLVYVLLVLVLLVTITIYVYMKDVFEDAESESECATQVRVHAKMINVTGGKANPTIKCPTKVIVAEVETEAAAKRAIAEEMRKCWSTWGEGQLQLFGKEEGVYCHVCSMVTIQGVEKVDGFMNYLADTPMSRSKTNLTYEQYLSGVKAGPVYKDTPFKQQVNKAAIPTTQPIGVVFYHTKGLTGYQRFKNSVLGDSAVAGTAGGVTGAAAGVVVGMGIVKVGAAMGVSGVFTIPGAIVTGAGLVVTGAAMGLAASTYGTDYPDTMSLVLIRPLTDEQVKTLGCQYDPVSN